MNENFFREAVGVMDFRILAESPRLSTRSYQQVYHICCCGLSLNTSVHLELERRCQGRYQNRFRTDGHVGSDNYQRRVFRKGHMPYMFV